MNKKVDHVEYNTVYTMQIVKFVENQTCENNHVTILIDLNNGPDDRVIMESQCISLSL